MKFPVSLWFFIQLKHSLNRFIAYVHDYEMILLDSKSLDQKPVVTYFSRYVSLHKWHFRFTTIINLKIFLELHRSVSSGMSFLSMFWFLYGLNRIIGGIYSLWSREMHCVLEPGFRGAEILLGMQMLVSHHMPPCQQHYYTSPLSGIDFQGTFQCSKVYCSNCISAYGKGRKAALHSWKYPVCQQGKAAPGRYSARRNIV